MSSAMSGHFLPRPLRYDQTLDAMKQLAIEFAVITESYSGAGDPIELNHQLEPLYLGAARSMPVERRLFLRSARW